MKVIDLIEAKTNLERYARECQTAPVVVTLEGKPAFELIPIRADDGNFIDRLAATNPHFKELLQARHREADRGDSTPLEDVRKRIVKRGAHKKKQRVTKSK